MAKTASLKYNLASKQQKYTPYELKVVKERNKKRETTTRFNSRYGIYIILPTTSIFLSRPRIHQTIFCRMVHTTKEVAGEKEYITRGGQARQRCQPGRDLPFNAPMKKRVKNDGP